MSTTIHLAAELVAGIDALPDTGARWLRDSGVSDAALLSWPGPVGAMRIVQGRRRSGPRDASRHLPGGLDGRVEPGIMTESEARRQGRMARSPEKPEPHRIVPTEW